MRLATPTRIVIALILGLWIAGDLGSLAQTPAKNEGSSGASAQAEESRQTQMPAGRRRDPFEPLVRARRPGEGQDIPQNLPPGKAGLVVGTVRLDGIVQTTNGMIAVVANPQNRVYFIREGDRLYNGTVERITLESVSFRERGRDAFGNALDRVVVKRLYPSAGEQR